MSPEQTTSALTEDQQIEYIATKIMGWKKEEFEKLEHFCCEECGKCTESCEPHSEWRWRAKEGHPAYNGNTVGPWWDPVRKWDDWRMVEEKIMEDEKLWETFELLISAMPSPEESKMKYMQAELSTRCNAVTAAHQSLTPCL